MLHLVSVFHKQLPSFPKHYCQHCAIIFSQVQVFPFHCPLEDSQLQISWRMGSLKTKTRKISSWKAQEMKKLSAFFFSTVSLKFWECCGISPSFNKWEEYKPKLCWYSSTRSISILPFLWGCKISGHRWAAEHLARLWHRCLHRQGEKPWTQPAHASNYLHN